MRKITCALALAVLVSAGCETSATEPLIDPANLKLACTSPAPLVGSFDPRAPGYLVLLRSDVDVSSTVEALADKYGFEAGAIWEHALRGFFAVVPDETVRALRCEAAVQLIEHNAVVSIPRI